MTAQEYMQSLLGRSKNPLGYGTKTGTPPREFATGEGLSIFEGGAFTGGGMFDQNIMDKGNELLEQFIANQERMKEITDDLSKSMEHLFIDVIGEGAITTLEKMGAAMAKGGDVAGEFKKGMGDMVQAFMSSLPQLLLQAGINALATPGMFYVGLGLIAASGLSALLGGALAGAREESQVDSVPTSTPENQAYNGPQNTYIVYGDIYDEDRFTRRTSAVQSASTRGY
jgi:hypothetical protein